jgi:hypothetical protein
MSINPSPNHEKSSSEKNCFFIFPHSTRVPHQVRSIFPFSTIFKYCPAFLARHPWGHSLFPPVILGQALLDPRIQEMKAMLCLCLQQSGLWILDVARPVGRALKDDGRVGECAFVERNVRWIAASVVLHTLSSQ